jgi:hypothetical protein
MAPNVIDLPSMTLAATDMAMVADRIIARGGVLPTVAPPPPQSLLARIARWFWRPPYPVAPILVRISPETEAHVDSLCAGLGSNPTIEERMQLELFFESMSPDCAVEAVGGGDGRPAFGGGHAMVPRR